MHWFIRQDGAWLLRINLPGTRPWTVHRGIALPPRAPSRIAGYFYESDATTHALVALIRIPGNHQPLRHLLAYAEPSPRFMRWMMTMAP